MVAGGGAAKPPETQSKEMIRPRRARRGRRRPDLRHVERIGMLDRAGIWYDSIYRD